jgi:hypothetical protein
MNLESGLNPPLVEELVLYQIIGNPAGRRFVSPGFVDPMRRFFPKLATLSDEFHSQQDNNSL